MIHMKKACIIWGITALGLLSACNTTVEPTNNTGSTDTSVNTGDDSSDFVENETWDSTVSIVWNGSSATIGTLPDGITATNKDGYVALTSTIKHVEYAVSGSGTGQLTLYSDYKLKLSLNDLTLTCGDGPAINNQCSKSCYVVLTGTNTLTDGSTYSSSTEDRKAAFFSEGQLIFTGSGSLNVTGNCKHALASDDYIRLREGTLSLTANASDGMHTNDGIIINGGSLSVSAAGDGIQCDTSSIIVSGGTIKITKAGDKGILAYSNIQISGGDISIQSEDKGIKSAAGNIVISGGTVSVTTTGDDGKGILAKLGEVQITNGTIKVSTSGSDAKGIKSVGNMTISGGTITVICSSGSSAAFAPGWGGGGQGGPGNQGGGGNTGGPGNMGGGQNASAPEGIESKAKLTITGGTIYSQSSDDAINSGSDMNISGGYICAYSTGNDGIDANGNCYIKGGTVYAIGASSPEVGIDANTEGGYKLYVSGGTLVALGGLESGSSLTQSCYSANSWSQNTWYGLSNGGSAVLAFKTPSSAGSGIVVSTSATPTLLSGVSTTNGTAIWNNMGYTDVNVSGGSNVSLSSYSGGNNGMGGGRGW